MKLENLSKKSLESKAANVIYFFKDTFKKDFIYLLFLERGEGKKKERERNISVWLPLTPPAGDLAHNPGMCPDRESNQSTFSLQVGTQSIEPHQPGQLLILNFMLWRWMIALMLEIWLNLPFLLEILMTNIMSLKKWLL